MHAFLLSTLISFFFCFCNCSSDRLFRRFGVHSDAPLASKCQFTIIHILCSSIPLSCRDYSSVSRLFLLYLSPFFFFFFFLYPFLLSFCLPVLIDDVNANPNKRQRQPALLGDHPPEYGKALTPLGNKRTH